MRKAIALALAALTAPFPSAADGVPVSDYRTQCVEEVKYLTANPRPEGSPKLGDCVRDDITTGQVDMQSMGFAVMSDTPGPNVQKLIGAGFPAKTAQGAVVVGTLNKLFLEGRLASTAYLDAMAPLIDAGALVLFGNGPLDILSELLRSAPEPETVCGFAEIVGGFDVFEDRALPRSFADSNPAFGPAEREVLAGCGL
ncbi:hypothetical protein [Tropicimonas sediminicola]|uniref:Uncharacterized protein n=1 Tax=Tropicimonas sediminicola TaxID=1031541 RepID=A0A239ECE4_9RHOB|nr:hypothetical protein [Tropicimonas sediminicola]SNS42440.1 hypothetical protein SAMN05421757_10284 [Tropicimonas sediminicola]